MDKVLKAIGLIAIIFMIYAYGYSLGKEEGEKPTQLEISQENARVQASEDIYSIQEKYRSLYNLCEEKYQTVIKGNVYDAVAIKGQMTAIESQIDEILSKYDEKSQ